MKLIQRKFSKVYKYRWSASIILLFFLDFCSYMAFSKINTPQAIEGQDKLLHFIAFAVLFLIGHISLNYDFFPKFHNFSFRIWLLNVTIWVSYGIFIEAIQKLLSYRSASLLDLIANTIGVLFGSLIVILLRLYPTVDSQQKTNAM